jgi:hypothetical protein
MVRKINTRRSRDVITTRRSQDSPSDADVGGHHVMSLPRLFGSDHE